MKKAIIAMAVASVAGAIYADCGRPTTPTPQTPGADVYQIKMSLKTTTGKSTSGTAATSGNCGRSTPESAGCVIRIADSMSVSGWIYNCTNMCSTLELSSKNGQMVVWDTKRKATFDKAKIDWTVGLKDGIHAMGAGSKLAEGFGMFTGTAQQSAAGLPESKYGTAKQNFTLYLAGMGKFDTKYLRYTSLSGNVAGFADPSLDFNSEKCDPSVVYTCSTLTQSCDKLPKNSFTVAYGTWSIKYNSSASNGVKNNGKLTVPKYVDQAGYVVAK